MTNLTMLTLDQIEEAIGSSRTRGEYKPVISTFFASGDLAIDLTEKFPGKVAQSLRNSVELNVKKLENHPQYRTVLVGEKGSEHVVLINMDTYAAQREAEAANDNTEQ